MASPPRHVFGHFRPTTPNVATAGMQTPPQQTLEITGPPTVGMVTGDLNSTFIQFGSDMAQVASTDQLRVIPIFGKSSLQNLIDLLNLRGVDLALTSADSLSFAEQHQLFPGLRSKVGYLAKLYDQDVEIIAGGSFASMADLSGKTVNIDMPGSSTSITATEIFKILNIPIKAANYPTSVGLEKLKNKEIDAVVYISAKSAQLFAAIPENSDLHIMPIPSSDALTQTYGTATLTHADYPTLIADGRTVETLTVPVLLTAFLWPPTSPRYRNLAKFTELLFSHVPDLMQPPYNERWKDTDLLAVVPGWKRAPYARQWLGARAINTDKDQFMKWVVSVGLKDLTPVQSANLFEIWKSHVKPSPLTN